MNVNDIKAQFLTKAAVIKRDGVKALLEWLESSDFFTSPASARYHGDFEGGLALHSLRVYDNLLGIAGVYDPAGEFSKETLAIVALFHDLCKVGCYKTEMRWRKDDRNQWEQYATYRFEEDFPFGGHGSKSMYLVQHFVPLKPEEAAAINSHMGSWDVSSYNKPGDVFQVNKLAWMLHVADEAATYVDQV